MTPQHVLVVDDEERLTAFLRDFFSKLGYQMDVALSGEEALKTLEQHRPALMLLDMRMSGIDGIQVLKTVKTQYPAIKIIVMTSYDEEYKKAAEQYHADAFFPKPLSLAELIAKIEELLLPDDPPPGGGGGAPLPIKPDLIPKAKLLFVNLGPGSSLMMMGALHCVGEEPWEKELKGKEYHDAGDYQWAEASTRREVFEKLEEHLPDFVFIPVDWEQSKTDLFLREHRITASDLVAEIMRSKYAPKEIFLFGSGQQISRHNDNQIEKTIQAGGSVLKEPNWSDLEKQASKINRLLWQKCIKFGLMSKRPVQKENEA